MPPRRRVVALALGARHTCALLDDATVRCWGQKEGDGADLPRVGDDETAASAAPVELGGRAVQLSAGSGYSCALLDTGGVRCWGGRTALLGYASQHHADSTWPSLSPALLGDVPVGGRVVQVSTGRSHICALLEGGSARCWGDGEQGQLGYGSRDPVGSLQSPEQAGDVALGGKVLQIAAGNHQTCALVGPASVRCWGSDFGPGAAKSMAELGARRRPLSYPITPAGDAVVQLAVSGPNCVLLERGRVRCWGANGSGTLGYGHLREVRLPVADVPVGEKVQQLALGHRHVCALLEGGRVRCWGGASYGQLGYGNGLDIGDDETPASAGDVPVGGKVERIAAGAFHTCALLEGGRVRCWGDNSFGQLGYGSTQRIGDDETPAEVGDVQVLPEDPPPAAAVLARLNAPPAPSPAAGAPLWVRNRRARPPEPSACEPSCTGCKPLFDQAVFNQRRALKPRRLAAGERAILRRAYEQYLRSKECAASDGRPSMDPRAIGTAQDVARVLDVLDGAFSEPGRAETLMLSYVGVCGSEPNLPARGERLLVLARGPELLAATVGTSGDRLVAVDLEGDGRAEVVTWSLDDKSADADSAWIDLRSHGPGQERWLGRFMTEFNSCGRYQNQRSSYRISYRVESSGGAPCFLAEERTIACPARPRETR